MRTIKQFVTGKTRHMVALRWITLVVILATTALLLTLPATAQTKYVITDGDNVIVCLSNSTDPQEVIKEAGLKLGESDTYTTHISDGVSEIHITRFSYRNNIIKAAPSVHSKRKRSVLYLISKGKFHFIAVFVFFGASLNALPLPRFFLTVQYTV